MSRPGNLLRRIYGLTSGKPTNFSWVDEGVAGSGRPLSLREFRWLKAQGIEAILTVAEKPLPKSWIHSSDIHYMHVQWMNHRPPSEEGLKKSLDFIKTSINSGRKVAVHCGAGSGRTGTVLAAYLVKMKRLAVEDAIRLVREKRPGSIERDQEEYLRKYFRVEGDSHDKARIS